MNLQIDNRQKRYRLDRAIIRQLASTLFHLASRREPDTCWSEITVVLTDDQGIQAYKEAAFGYREITDVVTLRYAPSPADPGTEGEIFVNVQRAFTRPHRPDWTPFHELALYIAHGCDHLNGADDRTPAERQRMRRRERRWLQTPACREAISALSKKRT
jgi:rRNA maturation RNase YbeY